MALGGCSGTAELDLQLVLEGSCWPTKFQISVSIFAKDDLSVWKRSDLRVGALTGLGGGEGVLVKGREGKEGKEGKAGKEKVNGFGLVIGLKVVNGGW